MGGCARIVIIITCLSKDTCIVVNCYEEEAKYYHYLFCKESTSR